MKGTEFGWLYMGGRKGGSSHRKSRGLTEDEDGGMRGER